MASRTEMLSSRRYPSASYYHKRPLWDLRTKSVTNKVKTDFDWFVSADLRDYQGKHVAIYHNHVIGWGSTRIEAYRMAKQKEPDSRPALTYVDEDADTIL